MRDEGMVVVGGGIVGLCSAFAMQREGVPVLLIDPEIDGAAASWGNAGHIATEQAEPLASLATLRSAFRRLTLFGGPLGLPPRHIRHWAPFALRLAQASTPDRFAAGRAALSGLLAEAMPAWHRLAGMMSPKGLVREDGHIVAWFGSEAARRGLAAWRATDTGTATFRPATTDELTALGHVTARRPAGAIVFSHTGQVTDPGATLVAIRHAFRAAGGRVLRGLVTSVTQDGQGFKLTLDGNEPVLASRLLVASGIRSGRLLSSFGIRTPIIAERGYHIQAAAHRWPDALPPVVFEEHSSIATRFSGGLRLASFVEFGDMDAPPNPRRWIALERRAKSLNLPIDGPLTRWSGIRPTLPDYLPAIGQHTGLRNLSYAFGHQHLGLTLGPITGDLVAGLLLGRTLPVDLRPFDIARFSRMRDGT